MSSYRTFAHVTADKSALYRAVLATFVSAKHRFVLHLRPAEVRAELEQQDPPTHAGHDEVEAALEQLEAWGNLDADADTAEVGTIEEFYRKRRLYRLTVAGEATERAIAAFEAALMTPGELQATALADVRDHLEELLALAADDEPDAAKVHRSLRSLTERFDELTDRAQAFIASLQRTIDLHGIDLDAFLAYKDILIGYLERFIGELVLAQARIARLLTELDAGIAALLTLAADRDLEDAVDASFGDRAQMQQQWHARWQGLRAWFIGGATPAQAELLRSRARAAIPALLLAVAGINEQRVSRTDRPADLRTLARWFAQCPTDADAHRLWRAAFALHPARHLRIDADTLDARDADSVPAGTSWLDAPPVHISPRLRATGHYLRRGRPTSIIDRSGDKARLAELAAREAAELAAARAALRSDEPVRLSQLHHLDPRAFELFLDLLAEALARKIHPTERVRATSTDGSLEIVLEPTGDGRLATLTTELGDLTGPDHVVTIRDLFADHLPGDLGVTA